MTDYRLPTTDYQLPTTDHRLPTECYRPPTTDYRLVSTSRGAHATVSCRRAKCSSGSTGGSRMPAAAAIVLTAIAASAAWSGHG